MSMAPATGVNGWGRAELLSGSLGGIRATWAAQQRDSRLQGQEAVLALLCRTLIRLYLSSAFRAEHA